MTHFLSLDERRASRQGEREVKGRGQTQAKRLQSTMSECRWVAKILSNLSLIMVGPVLLCCTVWALVVDLWQDPISGLNQVPRLSTSSTRRHAWLAHHVPLGVTTTPDLPSPIPCRVARSQRRWIGPSHPLAPLYPFWPCESFQQSHARFCSSPVREQIYDRIKLTGCSHSCVTICQLSACHRMSSLTINFK